MALSGNIYAQSIAHAWEHLELGELEDAQPLIDQLLAAQVEEGYALQAASFSLDEEWESAVAILRQGIHIHPQAWRLYLEVSQRLIQLGQGEAALTAIEQAEANPKAEIHWIHFHKGQVLAILGKVDEALNTWQQVTHPDLINATFAQQLDLLYDLQRYDLIIDMAKAELEQLPVPKDEAEAEVMSQIVTYVGKAYAEESGNEEATLYYLRQAIAFDRTNVEAITALRELDPVYDPESKVFHLNVEGLYQTEEVDEDGEAIVIPFVTSYALIAASEEEAMDIIKAFEPPEVIRTSLEVEDIEISENEDEEATGMYMVTPLMFLDGADDDDLFELFNSIDLDQFDLDDFGESPA